MGKRGTETYGARKYTFEVHGVEGVRSNHITIYGSHLLWDVSRRVDPVRPETNSRRPQPGSSLSTHQLVYDFGSVSGRSKNPYMI